MGNGRIFVGYCSGGSIDQCMMDSLTRAKEYDLAWAHETKNPKLLRAEGHAGGLYITMNRNGITRQFLESDCEWFWSLDTDMQFQPNTGHRLVEIAHPTERPIVSAIYFGYIGETSSLMQPVPIWFDEHPDGMPFVIPEMQSGRLEPLKNIGFGCCLIHRSVFEKMEEHYGVIEHNGALFKNDFTWFDHDPIWCDEEIQYRGHTFRKLVHAGEDITFCQRARRLGFSIWGSPDIETNHLKKRFENIATFQKGGFVTVSQRAGVVV